MKQSFWIVLKHCSHSAFHVSVSSFPRILSVVNSGGAIWLNTFPSEQHFTLSFQKTSCLMPWNIPVFGAGLGMVAGRNNDLNFQALDLHFPVLARGQVVRKEHANVGWRFWEKGKFYRSLPLSAASDRGSLQEYKEKRPLCFTWLNSCHKPCSESKDRHGRNNHSLKHLSTPEKHSKSEIQILPNSYLEACLWVAEGFGTQRVCYLPPVNLRSLLFLIDCCRFLERWKKTFKLCMQW